MEIMNAKSFEHTCSNGTVFKSERGDLASGVKVLQSFDIDVNEKMADYAEFGAWHSIIIHPNLNGFAGYDCIKFEPEKL